MRFVKIPAIFFNSDKSRLHSSARI